MKNVLALLFIISIMYSCKQDSIVLNSYTSKDLKIEKLSKNLFRHVSYLDTEDYGKVSCNGMIYVNNDEAIIFDTPTNNKASAEMIDWIGNKNIKAIIATHFHDDCIGGLKTFHSRGIKSYASKLTINLSKENNNEIPLNGFETVANFKIGKETVLVKHFGEGHTIDNVVAYVPSEQTLFGGCLIKGAGAGKGNLADANTDEWAHTVTNIKEAFPTLEIVIPGHGKSGGTELLDYTIDLFTE